MAAIEVRFVMARELLHAVAEIEQAEVARADVPATRSQEQLAAALEHVDAHVVDERACDLARSSHADVVARIRAGAARSVRHQQVVPAIMEDHHGRFRVDGDVDRRAVWMQAFAGLRIQFDETDIPEVRTVGEPERPVGGIEQDARIDGVAVLDAVGPHDGTAIFPFVVRRIRIERPADEQTDRGLRLRAGRRVVDEELVAHMNHVRRPGVVPPTRDHIRSGTSTRHGLHQGARPSPRPAVIGDGERQTVASGIHVELAVVYNDRGRIVQAGLSVQRQCRRDEQQRSRGEQAPLHRRFARGVDGDAAVGASSNESVRLKNGITCSWNRTATWLVCVPE